MLWIKNTWMLFLFDAQVYVYALLIFFNINCCQKFQILLLFHLIQRFDGGKKLQAWFLSPCVFFSLISFNLIRLIGVERFPCWGFEIGNHMRRTKPRSMMIWQWSTYLMFFSFLSGALLYIHSCTRSIKAGILGYSPPSQAAFTCLVSPFFLCINKNWIAPHVV